MYLINLKKYLKKKSKYSNNYINKTFIKSIQIIKKYKVTGLINGPISKKNSLREKYQVAITEYLTFHLTKSKNTSMLIYNEENSLFLL